MKPASAAVALLKVVLLTVILFVTFAVVGATMARRGHATESAPPSATGEPTATPAANTIDTAKAQAKMALALLVTCFIHSATAAYLVVRSRWRGLRLMATIFVLYFGTMAVMSQIETAFFVRDVFAGGGFTRMLLMQFIVAIVLAPAAVALFGRGKPQDIPVRVSLREQSRGGTIALLTLAYVSVYLIAGYYLVWTQPVAREFYGGADATSFLAHVAELVQRRPLLILLQVLRGLLWVGLAVPIVRMWSGPRGEVSFVLALLFGVAFPALLLLPNPIMPESIRMLHLVEVGVSNILFVILTGWLITKPSAT